MESKASRTCTICRQIKLAQYFPKMASKGRPLEEANICLACRAASLANFIEGDEEGGSGGKQIQHTRDAKQLQYDIELEAALQKEVKNQSNLTHNKDIFGMSQLLEHEHKKQAVQRALLDLKEDIAKNTKGSDEPNPDLALDTQARREKITRLFSVTRSLARNYVAANNAKAIAQKNFGIFSHTKGQKVEQTHQANTDKALSKKSSTLFSQSHSTKEPAVSEAEKLELAIRKGQKIFNK